MNGVSTCRICPVIGNASGKLALAPMREGRGLNHPGYALLSFFRALETAIPGPGCLGNR